MPVISLLLIRLQLEIVNHPVPSSFYNGPFLNKCRSLILLHSFGVVLFNFCRIKQYSFLLVLYFKAFLVGNSELCSILDNRDRPVSGNSSIVARPVETLRDHYWVSQHLIMFNRFSVMTVCLVGNMKANFFQKPHNDTEASLLYKFSSPFLVVEPSACIQPRETQ